MKEIVLKPIGIVRSEVKEQKRGGWAEVTSEIAIEEDLTECLDGLEEFSHIIVVYWMHRVPTGERPPAKVHPRGRADLPLVGLFATRAPHRPNALGLSVVRLEERKGNILRVVGLDAIDGTPVIDIKPYLPRLDSPSDVRVADWTKKLECEP